MEKASLTLCTCRPVGRRGTAVSPLRTFPSYPWLHGRFLALFSSLLSRKLHEKTTPPSLMVPRSIVCLALLHFPLGPPPFSHAVPCFAWHDTLTFLCRVVGHRLNIILFRFSLPPNKRTVLAMVAEVVVVAVSAVVAVVVVAVDV